jgi:hypothetical protein
MKINSVRGLEKALNEAKTGRKIVWAEEGLGRISGTDIYIHDYPQMKCPIMFKDRNNVPDGIIMRLKDCIGKVEPNSGILIIENSGCYIKIPPFGYYYN